MGVLPFASEQPQGVIKMPDTPSIQEALLAGTANFVAADIVKARLNGTILIDMLEKEVDSSTLTITYSVPMEQVQEITKVELLDSTGTVLTTSTVYVPVDASTIIKHTIPVAEGVTSNG